MHPRIAALLKRRSIVLSAVIVTALLGLALALFPVRASAWRPKILGRLKPEGLRGIKRAIFGTRWTTVRGLGGRVFHRRERRGRRGI